MYVLQTARKHMCECASPTALWQPGDGTGYVKHRDVDLSKVGTKPYRTITLLYYLNKPDWDASRDGGSLRVTTPASATVAPGSTVDISPMVRSARYYDLFLSSLNVLFPPLPPCRATAWSSFGVPWWSTRCWRHTLSAWRSPRGCMPRHTSVHRVLPTVSTTGAHQAC